MEKGYNLGFESHPTSKDVGFHGANKQEMVNFNESEKTAVAREECQHQRPLPQYFATPQRRKT
jgi:hypothetical protein